MIEIVRHLSKRDPTRDPNLENCPSIAADLHERAVRLTA